MDPYGAPHTLFPEVYSPSATSSPMTTARFDPTGKNIFVGTASGCILVFNTRTKIVRLLLYYRTSLLISSR